MKKYIYYIMMASLLALVGCQQEELVNDNNTPVEGEKVILTANIQGSTQTRVALTPATDANNQPIIKVEWDQSGESFRVSSNSASPNSYTTFTQIEGTNQFEGTLPNIASNESYIAFYGYDLRDQYETLDAVFAEQDGTLDQDKLYMMAQFSDPSQPIQFQHTMAILKPTFTVDGNDINNTITEIKMGGIACPVGSGNLEGIDTITITPSSSVTALDEDIYIHLCVPGNDYSTFYSAGREFTFTVTAGGKNYTGSLIIPSNMHIESGKLYTAEIELENSGALVEITLPDGVVATKVSLYDSTNGALIECKEAPFNELPSFEVPITIGGGLVLVETDKPEDVYKVDLSKEGQSFSIGALTKATKTGQSDEVNYAGWNGDMLIFYGEGEMQNYTETYNPHYAYTYSKGLILEGVTNVGSYTFRFNTNRIKSVVISNTVTSIGEAAFNNCQNLINVTIPNTVTSIGKMAFKLCKNLESVNIPNGIKSIEESTFGSCTKLQSIVIPETVTSIAKEAFIWCKVLTSIEIPSSVRTIGIQAFDECSALASLTLSEGLETIGEKAFFNCPCLTSVIIPSTVSSLGNYAFYNTNMEDVTCLPTTPPACFYPFGEWQLDNLYVPESSIETYKKHNSTSGWGQYWRKIKPIPSSGE